MSITTTMKQGGDTMLLVVIMIFALFAGLILYFRKPDTGISPPSYSQPGQTDQQQQPTHDSDLLNTNGQQQNQQQVFTPPPEATTTAADTHTNDAIDRLVNRPTDNSASYIGSTDEVNAAINTMESGGTITFHDPTFRRQLSDRVEKMGGQVGYYTTGDKALSDWTNMLSEGPNSSNGMPIDVPSPSRPGGTPVSDQNDAVTSMLDNIAEQGYVLQKAKPTYSGGYLTGAQVP